MKIAPRWRLVVQSVLALILTSVAPGGVISGRALANDQPPKPARRAEIAPAHGRELFTRQWVPEDARSRAGDGLGPVYNERSCMNCHDQGGPGGAGSADKNIELITPVTPTLDGNGNPGFFYYSFSYSFGPNGFEYHFGDPPKAERNRKPQANPPILAELVQIHPGFRNAPSVVLHRYGNDRDYRTWREWVLGKHGSISFHTSQRNPTPLFGMGLVDAIPDNVIEAAARHRQPGSPGVHGRVSRLPDGRIGRFGWKAQTPTLREFILNAASVELGLEVPGHTQAADPRIPPLPAPGLDMNRDDCEALIAYVRSLPAPVADVPADIRMSRAVKSGKVIFRSIGCAACHVPKLGNVDAIYSDLLLHDMSPELSDTGIYGAFVAAPKQIVPPGPPMPGQGGRADRAPAKLEEWRTPPLWGLRDSFPYLHDGRAATIDQAILLHGGEASASAKHYRQLSPRERSQLELFLLSLAAPRPADNLARQGP
jgi:mono/diheme cytochrome c family protein